jgi:hypothetical protein
MLPEECRWRGAAGHSLSASDVPIAPHAMASIRPVERLDLRAAAVHQIMTVVLEHQQAN